MAQSNVLSKKYLSVLFVCAFLLVSDTFSAEHFSSEATDKVKLVANRIINDVLFVLNDPYENCTYKKIAEVSENIIPVMQSPYNDWRYWNGVLNIAMITLGRTLGDDSYIDFAKKNVSFGFEFSKLYEKSYRNENKWSYPFAQKFVMEELDDCGAMGAGILEVMKYNPEPEYLNYVNNAAEHILKKQTRLKDGSFVRAFPHEYTLWADDLYMGLSFLTRMYEFSGDSIYINDAVNQVINFHKYLFDENQELMTHCWYSDLDKKGVAFWGRANGWALIAQVDLLDRLPADHPKRNTLLSLLEKQISGIAKCQSGNGLWHQLLDKTDSYLETSCSAMFAYTIARAVNKSYIDPRFASIALRGWQGVQSKILEDGQVEGVCTGTVVSDNLVDYYNRPTPLNDVHGIGTVILAGAEIISLKKYLNITE